jgi:hypothetical protein
VRAAKPRELDREAADAAGATVDQNPLSLPQLAVVEQALPGAEPGERDRRALEVVERARFRCEDRFGRCDVVGGGPVAIEGGEPVDLVSDLGVLWPGPVAAMTPESSYDGVAGSRSSGQVSSLRVIAPAWTRTSTSPGPGRGTETRS